MKIPFFLIFLLSSWTLNFMHAVEQSHFFFIEASQVAEQCLNTNQNPDELLKKLVPVAQTYAHPEISDYYVGAAVLGKSGAIYLGANFEFKGVPLNATIHAEQFAIANARNHGETELVAIAISAAPCGHCRQFMNEMEKGAAFQIYIGENEGIPLSQLLPEAFGPGHLGLEGGLLAPQCQDKVFTLEYSLHAQALVAAHNSYAPYSNSKSGIAIQLHNGQIYKGSYLENIGFNPSLSPLQVALVAFYSDFRSPDEIKEVLLIEKSDPKISQAETSKELLNKIAPHAHFQVENHNLK